MARGTLCDIEKGRQLVSTQLAVKVAKKAGLPQELAVKACLQDQVRKAGLSHQVELVAKIAKSSKKLSPLHAKVR